MVEHLGTSSSAFLSLFVAMMATFQLTRLIVVEDGPVKVFSHLRTLIGRFTVGIYCTHCVGVWVAIVVALMLYSNTLFPLLVIMAIAGGNTVLQIVCDRLSTW